MDSHHKPRGAPSGFQPAPGLSGFALQGPCYVRRMADGGPGKIQALASSFSMKGRHEGCTKPLLGSSRRGFQSGFFGCLRSLMPAS